MNHSVADLLFYLGKVAERLYFIDAAAGTSGNISVKVDGFPVEGFPKKGARKRYRHQLDADFSRLSNKKFLITGSGKNLRYISERPHECLALIELVDGAYDILWGLEEGEKITSEYPAHFTTYQNRPEISAFLHAQPTSINVLTRLFRSEDSLNRLLCVQHEQIKLTARTALVLLAP